MADENQTQGSLPVEKIKPLQLLPETTPGFGNAASFELIQRAAKMLSQAKMLPKVYENDVASCAIGLNIALRMGADPLMVLQNLYVVQGKPGWSSAFLIATFNTGSRSHGFGRLRFKWTGEPGSDLWSCCAYAKDLETGELVFGTTITMKMVKAEGWYSKNGSKWQTMPEQMFMYRAASFFIRAYAPEISLGLQTTDELQDAFETIQNPDGSFSVAASAGRHPGADAAVDAVAQPAVDPHKKESLIAELAIKAEGGVEALEMAWAFMNEDDRLVVGIDAFDRIKKIAAEKDAARTKV